MKKPSEEGVRVVIGNGLDGGKIRVGEWRWGSEAAVLIMDYRSCYVFLSITSLKC